MYNLSIISNGHILARELESWSQIIPNRLNTAARNVAYEFIADCKIEIDKMIYSSPSSSERTGNLRRSHHATRLQQGVYLVFNDAQDENGHEYAWWQHEGWTDRSGTEHAGRPWMDEAMNKNVDKYAKMFDEAVSGLWR